MKEHGAEVFGHLLGHYADLIALIGLGSVVHAIVQHNEAQLLGKRFRVMDFAFSTFIAIFAGTAWSMIAWYWTHDYLPSAIMGMLGAFLGLKGLNRATDLIIDFITRSRQDGR